MIAARTSDVLRALDRSLLGPTELRRCSAARLPAEQDARAAARLLARWGATQLAGGPIEMLEVHQRCLHCGSTDHGRPWLRGLAAAHVSLAHTTDAVVVGVGWQPVGVDIETVRSLVQVGIAARTDFLTESELRRVHSAPDPARAFLRHWTLKECLVKVGVADLDTLVEVEVEVEVDVPTGRRAAGERTAGRYGRLHLVDWFDEDLSAVVAAVGSEAPEIMPFQLGPQAELGTGPPAERWQRGVR